ncbi:SKI family transcriptional corepressor 2 [Suricata suricatta]|uniref:SKI family transcriptional corepressor 2 n=1 Tax=Suricata suricatta TaxID=37032 RepID=UPI001155B0A8|nr:SKI family transcriptional corepressor 2 [Suricata suricatta]
MASSPLPGPNDILLASPSSAFQPEALSQPRPGHANLKPNQVGQVILYGIPIVSLVIDGQERLCLAQISNTLLKNFSYNEIHNRRVALGITCVQCTPVQLEILRRAGAMPISSRRCGMITKREAERLCKSFLGENRPPKLPDNFAFDVSHECAWGCRGSFIPARYNSSRAKCIKCSYCNMYFSPNKFIFHSHRTPDAKYTQPDAANFNSWRRHLKLTDKSPQDELVFAWEDVKAMFNGGSRKRALPQPGAHPACHPLSSVKAAAVAAAAAVAGGGGLLGPHLLAGAVSGAGAAATGAGPAGARVPAPHHPHLLEGRKAGGGSYHHSSAFRPVGGKDDAESLAKLHGASAGAPHSTQAHHHHHHHQPHHHHHHHPPQPPSPLLLLPPQPDEPGSERHHPAPPPPPPPPPPLALQQHHRGLLSPGGTSCSYPSEDSSEEEDDEEEEQEVDVEGHKPPEGEEEEEEGRDPDDDEEEDEEAGVLLGDPLVGGGRYLQGRGLSEKGSSRDRAPAAAGAFPLAVNSSRLLQEDGKLGDPSGSDLPLPPPPPPPLASQKAGGGGSSSPGSPVHHPSLEEQPSYKDNQKTKENNQVILPTKDDSNFSDKNKDHSFFITDSDASGGDFWRERSGEHTQETNSPHSLKKDVENMGKEELQKVLFEQIDLRRRLEQEFQVLKGNTSFPVFNNFQDQMKRELAYREEMVQQLQIIPYAASLIRKEKLGAHLSKS